MKETKIWELLFIDIFFVLIYTPVEINKNMIKTRTKYESKVERGKSWSCNLGVGETEGSKFF